MKTRPADAGRSAVLSLFVMAGGAHAVQPGDYSLRLQDRTGETRQIGSVSLRSQGGSGLGYRIDWDAAQFDDHFLSMRPFKCIPHPVQLICHLPYPYEIRRVISAQDLTDLEYDLLFLHKTPAEYGIDAWNGLYYRLAVSGDGIVGELHETDLNVLQAPPEPGDLRPIDPAEIYPASERHWPQRILIAPLAAGVPN